MKSILRAVSFVTISLISGLLMAAPHHGETYYLQQSSGEWVEVRVFGDEFYQRVESPLGYTVMRESASQTIVFAELSKDGNGLVSTGIPYHGPADEERMRRAGRPTKLRIHPAARREIAMSKGAGRVPVNAPIDGLPRSAVVGDLIGLTLLVDFSDEPAKIPRHEIEQMINGSGYYSYGNRGSVREYFAEMSKGRLNYTNIVTDYIRAKSPKVYYDTGLDQQRVPWLIHETLLALDKTGFDYTSLSIHPDDSIVAINLFYAGTPTRGWRAGLWPHQGAYRTFFADGVRSGEYQIAPIGDQLGVVDFCHENGHLIADFPDLYDYDFESEGIGAFGLMGWEKTKIAPAPVNAYFRHIAGWLDAVDITDAPVGTLFAASTANDQSFIFRNENNAAEFFFIEARYPQGRGLPLPGHGLLIWHVDENESNRFNKEGNNNNNEQMTEENHYYVSLEQADGRFHLERGQNQGRSDDTFRAGNGNAFSDTTVPDAKWWDGSDSGLSIGNISPIAETMYFTIGNDAVSVYSIGGTVAGLQKTASRVHFDGAYSGMVDIASDGSFSISDLVEGTYALQAISHNLYSDVVEVTVGPSQTDVKLAIQLPEIEVDTTPIAITVNEDEPYGAATFNITNPGDGVLTYASSIGAKGIDIVINELFVGVNSPPDGVELWNRSQTASLGGWRLVFGYEGGSFKVFTFPSGTFIEGGTTLVVTTSDDVGQGVQRLYTGFPLRWNHDQDTVFSVALVDGLGNGVDFVRSLGSSDEPPFGTEWTGDGVALEGLSVQRNQNTDSNTSADWRSSTSVSTNAINEGQTEVTVDELDVWISLDPPAHTVDPGSKHVVSVRVDGSGYPGDTVVSDTIAIQHNAPGAEPFEIPCEMNVEEGAPEDTDTDSDTDTGTESDSEPDSDSDSETDTGDARIGGGSDGCGCSSAGSPTRSPFESIRALAAWFG